MDADRNMVDFDFIDASLQPAPRDTAVLVTNPMPLESVRFREHPRGGKIIQYGDIIRGTVTLEGGDKISLDILLRGQANIVRPRMGKNLQRQGFEISIRGAIFPNEQYHPTIESPAEFAACLRRVDPRFDNMKSPWKSLILFRNGEELGSLNEIRQATAFAEKEADFDCHRKFKKNRIRKINREQNNNGFEIASYSGLYRKVKKAEYHLFNKGAILDLGQTLNNALSQLADNDQHIIVPYDFRMVMTDGIPAPDSATMDDIYNLGPDTFGTEYTRELAASGVIRHTWSKGHAFCGAIGLMLGCQDPYGVKMSLAERGKVANFHDTYVSGKIMHYPLPINRAGMLHCGNSSSTYVFDSVIDDWVLDLSGPFIAAGVGLAQPLQSQPQYALNNQWPNIRKIAQSLTRFREVPVAAPAASSRPQKQKMRPAPVIEHDDEDSDNGYLSDGHPPAKRGRSERTGYIQAQKYATLVGPLL